MSSEASEALSIPAGQYTALSEFLAGLRAELPILIGVIPFGLIYGALAMGAHVPPNAAQAMSAIVFAGSSQFVAAGLFGQATPALVIILTAAIINLRHMLYSASIAPYTHRLSTAWKCLLAYLLTDEAYAVSITHYTGDNQAPEKLKHWYFLGAGLALWTCWQLSTAAGIFLGGQVPTSWALDFTIDLTFIALALPLLKDRPSISAALAAGLTALAFHSLPLKLGLVIASLVGIGVGFGMEEWRK
jgi:4-azaleucine resistance transporter AzlC